MIAPQRYVAFTSTWWSNNRKIWIRSFWHASDDVAPNLFIGSAGRNADLLTRFLNQFGDDND